MLPPLDLAFDLAGCIVGTTTSGALLLLVLLQYC
jgi:hypothetical protein